MSEISAGYDPRIPDPDDPDNRVGWLVDDYLSRLRDGSMEVSELTAEEMRMVMPRWKTLA